MIVFASLVWFTMKFVWPDDTRPDGERSRKIARGNRRGREREKELAEANVRRRSSSARRANARARWRSRPSAGRPRPSRPPSRPPERGRAAVGMPPAQVGNRDQRARESCDVNSARWRSRPHRSWSSTRSIRRRMRNCSSSRLTDDSRPWPNSPPSPVPTPGPPSPAPAPSSWRNGRDFLARGRGSGAGSAGAAADRQSARTLREQLIWLIAAERPAKNRIPKAPPSATSCVRWPTNRRLELAARDRRAVRSSCGPRPSASLDVDVVSARSSAAEQRERLQAVLERRLGPRCVCICSWTRRCSAARDRAFGDLVIDGSLRGRIERLGAAMNAA